MGLSDVASCLYQNPKHTPETNYHNMNNNDNFKSQTFVKIHAYPFDNVGMTAAWIRGACLIRP
ncbi:hypothetical protein HanIR_Chr17g0879691 [Helianthus annuus]|nr:hypothetical protein HanIR_Chr17g0879691 [Helianthus annuus]